MIAALRWVLLAAVAAVVLVGCSQLPPPTHYYLLQVESRMPSSPGDGLAIGVRPFQVAAAYDRDSLAYRIGETSPEIHYYAYHRWAAPLSRMLPEAASQRLGAAAGVGSMAPVQAGRRYDAYLDGRLLALEEIDIVGEQRVRVRLTLSLTSGDGEAMWSADLGADRALQATEVVEIVEAMSSAFTEAFDRASADLARALGSN